MTQTTIQLSEANPEVETDHGEFCGSKVRVKWMMLLMCLLWETFVDVLCVKVYTGTCQFGDFYGNYMYFSWDIFRIKCKLWITWVHMYAYIHFNFF